jgi:arginase
MPSGKIAVFGVPTSAGGRWSGVAQAPLALREAGLLDSLGDQGLTVVNLSDLSLFPYRSDESNPTCRNAPVVACAIRAAADEMGRALNEGFTLLLGGDCTLVVGLVAGARRALGRDVGLVYLDANADLNTPETSPSGFLNGMALALALGWGPSEVTSAGGPAPALSEEHVALVGFRELDPGERHRLGNLGLALPSQAAREIGMRATSALALDAVGNADGPLVVHLDVDVIDPSEMPAKDELTPGRGLTLSETGDLLTALLASPRVVALEVTEFNPGKDPDGRSARDLVAILSRAVARHFRVR